METDFSNPAALAYWDNVDETALEATIRPQAVFADVTIQGTLSDPPMSAPMSAPAAVAPAPTTNGLGMNWIALFALAILAIGVIAAIDNKG